MISIGAMKTGLKHPDKAVKYLIRGRKKFHAIESLHKYGMVYQKTKKYNEVNSKYPVYFDFCKRILSDSLSNKDIHSKFFNNLKSLSEQEIISATEQKPDIKELTGVISKPKTAHTKIGLMRLENLQFCIEDILKNRIDGELMETGVWRGGSTIFMRLILKKYGINHKTVFVADSFEGLPKPNVNKYPKDVTNKRYTFDPMKVSLEDVKNNFNHYGVLDNQVKFLKGWFKDTLKEPPFDKLSILRLDGVMYGSTWDVLENVYDKVTVGGYIIVDDYRLPSCKAAIDDFRSKFNIEEPILPIDGQGIYWKIESQK